MLIGFYVLTRWILAPESTAQVWGMLRHGMEPLIIAMKKHPGAPELLLGSNEDASM